MECIGLPGTGTDARENIAAAVDATDGGEVVAGFRHEIKAMLFADAVGYSRLTEDQIPIFVARFLGSVARLNREVDYAPIHSETAGDGLYMVFASVSDAGRYAVRLSELVHGRGIFENRIEQRHCRNTEDPFRPFIQTSMLIHPCRQIVGTK